MRFGVDGWSYLNSCLDSILLCTFTSVFLYSVQHWCMLNDCSLQVRPPSLHTVAAVCGSLLSLLGSGPAAMSPVPVPPEATVKNCHQQQTPNNRTLFFPSTGSQELKMQLSSWPWQRSLQALVHMLVTANALTLGFYHSGFGLCASLPLLICLYPVSLCSFL